MGGNRDHPGVEASDPVAGPWKIDFVHRTIQEYLTAKEIAEEDHIGALLDVAHLDLWQQVVIMTVAIQTSRCGLSSSLTWSTVRTGNVDTAERSPCSPPPA